MNDTARTTFLSRVGAAVRAGNKHREAARRELPPTVGYVGAGDDPIGRLCDELTKVGVRVTRVGTQEQVAAAVRSLVDPFSIRRAVLNSAEILNEFEIAALLRNASVELTTSDDLAVLEENARREKQFAADLGVAAPDWAIAETGSLVYAAGPAQTRSATLLPPVHLAVVDATCVLPDLLDLTARLAGRLVDGVLPRNVAIVTGPSKTGDIELKLTTGVHGPGEVHVLIWERK